MNPGTASKDRDHALSSGIHLNQTNLFNLLTMTLQNYIY